MATTQITLSDDNLLAEYVPIDKFKGVLEQRLAIGPDTLAMLIRDGQIAEASAGAHFAIGGLWRTLKDAIGGKHALRLLIADLKPFQLTTGAKALTKDNVPVAGEFTIELQVNPEKPANVLGLMKAHGVVTKSSVLERLAPHLFERVISTTIRRENALELRGNVGMQDKIQADAMKEVERIASDIGLMSRVVSVTWGFNEEEQALVVKRQKEREQEALERDFTILNREVERTAESTIFHLQSDLNVEKAKVSTEADLRDFILKNELSFVDARETGVRLAQMKALQHELELNRTQRLDGYKAQLEEEQQAIELARMRAQHRGVDRGVEIDDAKHGIEVAGIGGQRRDVEMDLAKREQAHEAEVRTIHRSMEKLDTEQRLALDRLQELQRLEIARQAHADQIETMHGLQTVELDSERGRSDIRIKEQDAVHAREMERLRLDAESKARTIEMLRTGTPEQIMAIQAGFSAEVANVLVEQARARATDAGDREKILREMIQLARDNQVASETQARQFFEAGVQGNVGVAQGVGQAVAAGRAGGNPVGMDRDTTECPGCHRTIPVTDRHCRYCGRQMRQ